MQVLKINVARSIWLFPIADLNPAGKALDTDLIDWLKEIYHFQRYPSTIFDFDKESQTLTFAGGKFRAGYDDSGKELNVSVSLIIYKDGLVANTESSTTYGDKFLENLIDSAVKHFDLTPPADLSKKLYFNEMDVRLDRPLISLNPKLERIIARISELRVGPPAAFEFSGINFFPEPAAQPTTSGFAIERKINTDWRENRYYTRAPLQTDAHILLIKELEEILA